MRFLASVLLLMPLFTPLTSLANIQFETLKTMDGATVYCQSAKDLGQLAFILEDTIVDVSSKSTETLEFNFDPNFYKCAKGANGPEWQASDINAFLSREVQTDRGLVKIVPISYNWVVYSENYTELNPDPTVMTKNLGSNYSVKISDLLVGNEKSRRNRGRASRGIITVFLKSVTKAVYPDGEELLLGQQASGSFHIVITLPAR